MQSTVLDSKSHPDETLVKIQLKLKSRDEEDRYRASKALANYTVIQSRELSTESFTQFMTDVYKVVGELINSSAVNEKIGGVMAIDALIDVDTEENASQVTRMVYLLRLGLASRDERVLLLASKALGKLARVKAGQMQATTSTMGSGLVVGDLVEAEVARALEWLGDRQAGHVLAAVLILSQMASNAPSSFYIHVQQFLDLIVSGALQDKDLNIRLAAKDALRACLHLLAERDVHSPLHQQWYQKIYDQAVKGLKHSNPAAEVIHGSLLALGELVRNTGQFMNDKYKPVCDSAMKFWGSNNRLIKKAIISLLPVLAKFSPYEFSQSYLPTIMAQLLQALRRDNERPHAFIAIGKIALSVRENITDYLEPILAVVRSTMTTKGRAFSNEALICVSMLAKAVGSTLQPYSKELLQHMFAGGLTHTLVEALTSLVQNIPDLSFDIQFKLLDLLSQVLVQKEFTYPGAPPRRKVQSHLLAPGVEHDPALVILALRTLGTFDFDRYLLTEFLRDGVMNYLSHDTVQIRKEACLTCCKLMVPRMDGTSLNNVRGYSAQVMSKVLLKLLETGISDPDQSIRRTVISNLDPYFDPFLAQQDNLRLLFLALNDEVFEIRELVMGVIGRCAIRNPAYVLPGLRKKMIELLSELEYSTDSLLREQSARLLAGLIGGPDYYINNLHNLDSTGALPSIAQNEPSASTAPLNTSPQSTVSEGHFYSPIHSRLVEPYVSAVLKVLIPRVKDSDPRVASCALRAIGSLARQAPQELMAQHVEELIPLIVETLQDYSSALKRLVALKCLGIVTQSTGYVIKPLLHYPKLLDVLFTIIKTDQLPAVRHEVIKVLGILGALDPHRHRQIQLKTQKKSNLASLAPSASLLGDEKSADTTQGSEDYYPNAAVEALLKIIKDPSLSTHHRQAVQAIMFMNNSLGLKCTTFLPQIMPAFMNLMRNSEPGFREFLLQQFVVLVSIVKQHVRDFLSEINQLIREYWSTQHVTQVLLLIEEVSKALNDEFRPYLPQIMPLLLAILHNDHSTHKLATTKSLRTLEVLNTLLDDYLHLVVPAVVKLFEDTDTDHVLTRQAIVTIGRLARRLNVSAYAARIIQPLVRALSMRVELRDVCMQTLCYLLIQLREDYLIFVPMVRKVLEQKNIVHIEYDKLEGHLLKMTGPSPVTHESEYDDEYTEETDVLGVHGQIMIENDESNEAHSSNTIETAPMQKLKLNEQLLRKAWETTARLTREDWADWIRRFSIELLRESPSPALRSCLAVADFYPLVRELFNVGFVSCWNELPEAYQDELVRNLEAALLSSNIPNEILQNLLDLAEFMEHDDKPLPIDIHTLGQLSEKCRAYAKALHYLELEFKECPSNIDTIEALISINNQLALPEAAVGILKYAQQTHQVELKESWYEKLGRWEKALEQYEAKDQQQHSTLEVKLGRMRCLKALGEWAQLAKVTQEEWTKAELPAQKIIAPMAAAAAWTLQDWDKMREYVRVLPTNDLEGAFYRAVMYIHRNNFVKAHHYIDTTRHLLDTELTALVGESYQRAYDVLVRLQQLAEMEEIIEYKKSEAYPERRAALVHNWTERLKGCERDPDVWQRLLSVRSLVIGAGQDTEVWLKFAALCRKSDRHRLAHTTLTSLLGCDPSLDPRTPLPVHVPRITFAFIKQLWAESPKQMAYHYLQQFATQLKNDNELQARVSLKLGQWQLVLQEGLREDNIPTVLRALKAATQLDPQYYRAWHAWAMLNFDVIAFYEKQAASSKSKDSKLVAERIRAHLVPAIHGFFRSIALSQGHNLQDTLRLLTLWFKYGADKQVEMALIDGFNTLSIDTWLQVIPQIIARVHSPVSAVRRLLHGLLVRIGKEHPQALVYPLTVASKSPSHQRLAAARQIMDKMRTHSAALVDQALMVSKELIRVAILWHELWHEGLEDASRLYFGEHNVDGMFEVLGPLHRLLDVGPETSREASFQQAYGRELAEALEWCKKYSRSGKVADLNHAWDLYYHAFRRINKQLPGMTTLELKHVSPKLLEARDMELAVPGTYKPQRAVVRIAYFQPVLQVITSKQRPRKLAVVGSDGVQYYFLLKGHEDLRQDERVMQLFGLVNTLLKGGRKTSHDQTRSSIDTNKNLSNLSIARYAVIPLSPNSGLIGWVPHCDTVHQLIRDYRQSRNIILNIEHRLMLQMSSDYDNLSLIQKVEVFEFALESTNGMDLERVLWLKSPNSEIWLERRTNYTRSLAVMSMVGYILGLGDRHPSNLMLDRHTGKIIHIDFGDCFEVAMQREKYPEKIPFRLTRMLTNAMEVSGIEGNFRSTCETVMTVLREHKESLMAVLEAFVHDPLINWRLLTNNGPAPTNATSALMMSQSTEDLDEMSGPDADFKPQRDVVPPQPAELQNFKLNMNINLLRSTDVLNESTESFKRPNTADDDSASSGDLYENNYRTAAPRGGSTDSGDDNTLRNASRAQNEAPTAFMPQPQIGVLNQRALFVINRVSNKLSGRDFNNEQPLLVNEQVTKLIAQATSKDNLCQCYIGWCPFW